MLPASQRRIATLRSMPGTRTAGIAGIEEEDAAVDLAEGFVGVAEHDHVGPFFGQAAAQRLVQRAGMRHDVMHHVLPAGQLHRLGFLQRQKLVAVSKHGRHGSDLLELKEDGHGPDIAAVQNVVHARKELRDFRVEEIVRVGKDADFHRGHALASSGSGSPSGSSAGAPASFSRGDSAVAASFMAPTKKAVNNPPLRSVLRKNCHVSGQPRVPVINAVSQP